MGQPLHKRGRVWSTSHLVFVLRTSAVGKQLVQGVTSNSMLLVINCDISLRYSGQTIRRAIHVQRNIVCMQRG